MTDRQLLLAWSNFLGRYEWHHAVTLTTRFAYRPAALSAEVQQRFVRRLARIAQHFVGWFWALEENVPWHPHLHVLLAGTGDLTTEQIQRAWTAGFTRATVIPSSVTAFEGRRAVLRYVTKSIGRIPDNFDLSRRWIPRALFSPAHHSLRPFLSKSGRNPEPVEPRAETSWARRTSREISIHVG